MIGRFSPKLQARIASLSRLSYVLMAFAVAFIGLTLAGVGFGFVFNFTHSAPFGLYREISDPQDLARIPAPYVFFCPDVRWPGMQGEPNYRKPMRTCPDGFAPLIKPVVAWPGDTVEMSSHGISVNGQLLGNTLTIDHDSAGHRIRSYQIRDLPSSAGSGLGRKLLQSEELRFSLFRTNSNPVDTALGSPFPGREALSGPKWPANRESTHSRRRQI